jgi:hypothetical protein
VQPDFLVRPCSALFSAAPYCALWIKTFKPCVYIQNACARNSKCSEEAHCRPLRLNACENKFSLLRIAGLTDLPFAR